MDDIILINGEEWFTPSQLCELVGISDKTMYLWVTQGKVEKKRVDKHSFYRLTRIK